MLTHADHIHPTVQRYVHSPEIAEEYDRCFSGNRLFSYDTQFLLRHLDGAARVLDIGCGTGRHLSYLEHQGTTTFGLDLSCFMIAEAKKNLAANGVACRMLQADMHQLPLLQRPLFDGVLLMFSTLGMVRTGELRLSILRQIRQTIRPEGKLLAHFHNRDFNVSNPFARLSSRLASAAAGREPGDKVMPDYRGILDLFLHSFSREEIEHLFSAAGYRIIELEALNPLRNGPYCGTNEPGEANGYLLAAGV